MDTWRGSEVGRSAPPRVTAFEASAAERLPPRAAPCEEARSSRDVWGVSGRTPPAKSEASAPAGSEVRTGVPNDPPPAADGSSSPPPVVFSASPPAEAVKSPVGPSASAILSSSRVVTYATDALGGRRTFAGPERFGEPDFSSASGSLGASAAPPPHAIPTLAATSQLTSAASRAPPETATAPSPARQCTAKDRTSRANASPPRHSVVPPSSSPKSAGGSLASAPGAALSTAHVTGSAALGHAAGVTSSMRSPPGSSTTAANRGR